MQTKNRLIKLDVKTQKANPSENFSAPGSYHKIKFYFHKNSAIIMHQVYGYYGKPGLVQEYDRQWTFHGVVSCLHGSRISQKMSYLGS